MKVKFAVCVEDNKPINLDLIKLIEEKALIQATNGGGKSYIIRQIAESSSKAGIPQVIMQKDPEFNSLRTDFDYVLVGDKQDDADIQISIKIAEILAKRIVESRASFIIDMSALNVGDRKLFLRLFLDEINSTKKKFWHDRFFILDEAHIFAPEKGKGQSEALRSVEELASQGRKKGFSLIACTQRPSKLSKDVTGELGNKFIGKAIDSEDRKRNAEELGMSTKPSDTILFRKLGRPNFHFYAFGSAITSDEPLKIKINKCITKHEIERGSQKTVIPTRKTIQTILDSLVDLPEEVEKEKQTIETLKKNLEDTRKTVFQLNQQIKNSKSKTDNPLNEAKLVSVIEDNKRLFGQLTQIIKDNKTLSINGNELKRKFLTYAQNHVHLFDIINEFKFETTEVIPIKPEFQYKVAKGDVLLAGEIVISDKTINLKKGEREILHEIATAYPDGISRTRVGTLVAIKSTGSTMSSYLSRLKGQGFIEGTGNFKLTELGKNQFQELPHSPQSTEEIMAKWLPKFKKGERDILQYLVKIYPNIATKELLGQVCTIDPDGSTMSSYLSRLKSNELITKNGYEYRASEELYQ